MRFLSRDVLLCFILLISFSINLSAQNKSNKGREFWLGYGHNVLFTQDPPFNTQTHVLYLSADLPAVVTVSVNGSGWSQTVNIPANTVDFSITIPKSGPEDARLLNEGFSPKGVHIVSDVPIVAYAHQYGLLSSGATMLMPVETFGYTYYSLNYSQVSNYVDSYSWFYVVASENNTRLEISPSDTTQGGWLPTQAYTVNLNKGEIYNVFGKRTGSLTSKDMSGSKVVSVAGSDGNCHPVGMFSGSSRLTICSGNGGEFVQQQIFPASAWGTKYVTYHSVNNPGGIIATPFLNYYRVAVRNPSTVVKRNGVVMTGLVNNFYYEFQSSSGDFIEADGPVLVAQYTGSSNECTGTSSSPNGDPEMIYLSPVEQGVKNAIFYNTRNQAITLSFANIILPMAAISSLKIDGLPVSSAEYITHPTNSNYAVAVKRFLGAGAQHSISCDSSFIATNYGLGTLESYGYNVGTLVNNLNAYTSIKNTYNTNGNPDTFTCPKTPVRLFIKTAYRLTTINWRLSKTAGIAPNTDSIISNPVPIDSQLINGRKYYTYTLQQDYNFSNPGTYTIPVSYTAPEIDQCNNIENSDVVVIVKPGPIADFSILNANCLRDSVSFTATSAAAGFNLQNFLWNFDDNTTQTTLNAKKKFSIPGNQTIRYRIFADNGCTGDTTKVINLFPEPIAKIGASSPACATDAVLISDTSSITTGTITNWAYDFGDGTTLSRNSNTAFTHSYTSAGTITIKLITTSNSGCRSDTAYRTVTVFAKPIAKYGYDRDICVGDSIRITDSSGISPGNIISWQYNFGDGSSLVRNTNTPFFHKYSLAGNFALTLVTTSSLGCKSDTFRKTITVADKLSAAVSYAGNLCVGSTINFTSSYAAGSGTNWYWNFGDGQISNTSSGNMITHTYSTPAANIVVRHVVSVGQGCASDTVFTILPAVKQSPVATFSILKDTVCENRPVLFSSPLTGINSWNWNFGNGTGTAAPPFGRVYTTAGTYTISLTVRDTSGCSSLPATDNLLVNPLPKVNAGADKYIQTGSSIMMDATVTPSGSYKYQWTPATGLNATGILLPSAAPANTTGYQLYAEDNISHCYGKDSVTIYVINELFIPNAFSPDGDNINDVWKIPGMALYPEALVTIYNRYGQKIFETKNYYNHPWDGTHKGIMQPYGSFVYFISLNDNKKQQLKGFVTIIR